MAGSGLTALGKERDAGILPFARMSVEIYERSEDAFLETFCLERDADRQAQIAGGYGRPIGPAPNRVRKIAVVLPGNERRVSAIGPSASARRLREHRCSCRFTEGTTMLLSLIALNDDEITIVTDVVRQWCCERKLDIDSIEGRRAITIAVDLVQMNIDCDRLFAELSKQLDHQ
ncbi:hypothetical protein JOH51_002743 [Rhizobium leguminosarum]|nr:hypothetical protein [Rhizobium leguminosarum]